MSAGAGGPETPGLKARHHHSRLCDPGKYLKSLSLSFLVLWCADKPTLGGGRGGALICGVCQVPRCKDCDDFKLSRVVACETPEYSIASVASTNLSLLFCKKSIIEFTSQDCGNN